MITVAELSQHIGADYVGAGDVVLKSIASLESAKEGDLSFLANTTYKKYLQITKASAVLVTEDELDLCPSIAVICSDPYASYILAANLLYPRNKDKPGIHQSAIVDDSASIHETASIGPGVVIEENVSIGAYTRIGPGCVIGNGVTIGEYCSLNAKCTLLTGSIGDRGVFQPGVVIGSDGFGNVKSEDEWISIPQIGSVQIGDDVSIGANTTIDRGAIDLTVIGNNVRIDNQVQIAHNVIIGDHTAIAGCVGIAGSAKIGANCQLAGGVGIVGHLEITDNVVVTGMTMVTHSIKSPGVYSSGTPLMDNLHWRKNVVRMKTLDKLVRRINRLEKTSKDS